MEIQNWFLVKNFTQNQRYAMARTEPTIVKETEKAFFLRFDTEYGRISGWFPKSVCAKATPCEIVCEEEKKGAAIRHEIFGEGFIESIDEDTVVCVFGNKKKTLSKDFISFKK